DLITEQFVVFVVSTTGQGEPPKNMKNFWKFIWRKVLPADCLVNVLYVVIALGDSSYQKYNMVGKKLYRRLKQLGATAFMGCCLGDDQHPHGYNGTLDPWLTNFWSEYLKRFPMKEGLDIIANSVLLPTRFQLKFVSTMPTTLSIPQRNSGPAQHEEQGMPEMNRGMFFALVKSNFRLTSPDHWQDVRLITLQSIHAEFKYKPGDVCMIQPSNSDENVKRFLQIMDLDPQTFFQWTARDCGSSEELGLPQPCSIDWLVRHHLDITSIPKSYFWEVLAGFSLEGKNRSQNKLQEFCSLEGQEELFSYCNRPRRNILEVLTDFPCTRKHLSLSHILDIIPAIKARAFSISSAPSNSLKELELVVAVVEYKTKLKELRKGLCSNYLAAKNSGNVIQLSIVDGTFVAPPSHRPLIMIGPGTGCSIFRSYIGERVAEHVMDNYLFFGCRYKKRDYLFKDEWEKLVKDKCLHLFLAFSRDQADKVYVQHVLKNNGLLLWNLIDIRGASILLSGNSRNMPNSVHDAFVEIFKLYGRLSEAQALSYMEHLCKEFRYQLETWS
ncbi:hypothetical protein HELRODRAFT_74964, partial [Helobdella robusta]|uniref:NADPH-dependent diflavin oxidoreductase 1 n=1 Tax=Helobdella robusta TaxID=6412 RepID=T1G1Y7_HELRO